MGALSAGADVRQRFERGHVTTLWSREESGSIAARDQRMSVGLVLLGHLLRELGYTFITPTPSTHRLIDARVGNETARSLRDVFGWSRLFLPSKLSRQVFELARDAGACTAVPNGPFWRPLVRFSSLGDLIFAHSAFPTSAKNAVFFGPDSYRFVRAIKGATRSATRLVDICCGAGVGGIALGKTLGMSSVTLADINQEALLFAKVNAALAGISAEVVESDLVAGVEGHFDLLIANPPYLVDEAHRTYRDGGGAFGEALAVRIVREGLVRLRANPAGGSLLLYTGAAITAGVDTFLDALRSVDFSRSHYRYEELDPDVFSEELSRPAYANVERIAAVLLQVTVVPQLAELGSERDASLRLA
jgi:release factor glutamine methyltransferase